MLILNKLRDFIMPMQLTIIKGVQIYETSKESISNYTYIGFININYTNDKCKCSKESKIK